VLVVADGAALLEKPDALISRPDRPTRDEFPTIPLSVQYPWADHRDARLHGLVLEPVCPARLQNEILLQSLEVDRVEHFGSPA